jgi:acyl-CoA thioesterase-1
MQIRAFPGVRLLACLMMAATLACGSREESTDRRPNAGNAGDVGNAAPRRPSGSLANEAVNPNSGDPRIVVLGDSLTFGLGLSPHEAYPALLQERLRRNGLDFHVVNAGISGDTSAGGLSRLDLALDGDVRVLVVALGANDGLRGLPVSQLRNNLSRIIERAQARGVTVVLAGMEAPTNWGADYTAAFHEVYPSLAKEYRVALVPFLLDGVVGIEHLNQRDGIHPNAAGDRIVAETVWTVLEPVVNGLAKPGRGASGS